MVKLARKFAWDEDEDRNIDEENLDEGEIIESALEDDEISAEEAGFMRGFLEED